LTITPVGSNIPVSKLVTVTKSITAPEIFLLCPEVKKKLWSSEFRSDGYFATTVGKHGDEETIKNYVKGQGQECHQLHEDRQLAFF
jgi:putative transposase